MIEIVVNSEYKTKSSFIATFNKIKFNSQDHKIIFI